MKKFQLGSFKFIGYYKLGTGCIWGQLKIQNWNLKIAHQTIWNGKVMNNKILVLSELYEIIYQVFVHPNSVAIVIDLFVLFLFSEACQFTQPWLKN
jgi:hypothetical protein